MCFHKSPKFFEQPYFDTVSGKISILALSLLGISSLFLSPTFRAYNIVRLQSRFIDENIITSAEIHFEIRDLFFPPWRKLLPTLVAPSRFSDPDRCVCWQSKLDPTGNLQRRPYRVFLYEVTGRGLGTIYHKRITVLHLHQRNGSFKTKRFKQRVKPINKKTKMNNQKETQNK
jgi:hypothetical protein